MTKSSVVARESQHTPLTSFTLPFEHRNQSCIFDAQGREIADLLTQTSKNLDEMKEQANFLVQVSNSHQALVGALNQIRLLTFGNGLSYGEWIQRVIDIREQAEQALRLAQGEK